MPNRTAPVIPLPEYRPVKSPALVRLIPFWVYRDSSGPGNRNLAKTGVSYSTPVFRRAGTVKLF